LPSWFGLNHACEEDAEESKVRSLIFFYMKQAMKQKECKASYSHLCVQVK